MLDNSLGYHEIEMDLEGYRIVNRAVLAEVLGF
jgi:hypothetical protein